MMNIRLNVALILILPLLLTCIWVGSALAVEGKPVGAVSSFYGDVNVLHKGETEWMGAKLGLGIFQYDTVKTAIKSKVRITFEDGSLLNLSEDTQIEIKEHVYTPEEQQRMSLFAIARGKMRVFCQKFAGKGSSFQVETPTAVIGLRGTEFIVWVVSNELTTVICLSDEVFVKSADEKVAGEVILKPNQMTKVGLGVSPLPASIAPDELRHQLEIDTAAFKMAPSSANPEAAKEDMGAKKAEEAAAEAPLTPTPLELIGREEEKLPDLPPFPQDPGAQPEFKPTLPEPPGLPQPPSTP